MYKRGITPAYATVCLNADAGCSRGNKGWMLYRWLGDEANKSKGISKKKTKEKKRCTRSRMTERLSGLAVAALVFR